MNAIKFVEQRPDGYLVRPVDFNHQSFMAQVGGTVETEGEGRWKAFARIVDAVDGTYGGAAIALVNVRGMAEREENAITGDLLTLIAVVDAETTLRRCLMAAAAVADSAIADYTITPATRNVLDNAVAGLFGKVDEVTAAWQGIENTLVMMRAEVAALSEHTRANKQAESISREYHRVQSECLAFESLHYALTGLLRYVENRNADHTWQRGWPAILHHAVEMYACSLGHAAVYDLTLKVVSEMERARTEANNLLIHLFPELGLEE